MRFTLILAALLFSPGVVRAAAPQGLGTQILFDGTKIPAAQWKTSNGIVITTGNNKLAIQNSDETAFGWATLENTMPINATVAANFQLAEITNGKTSIQIEWLRQDGSFIKDTALLPASNGATAISAQSIAKLIPVNEKAARFKLKFWIDGKNAKATYTQALVVAPRKWRTAGTTLLKIYGPATPRQAEDGMMIDDNSLEAGLMANTKSAAFILSDRADYKVKGTVMLDLAYIIKGQLTVQALCFGKDGNYTKSVDLIKDVSQPGLYEVAFNSFAGQFPDDTAQVSFKVWLAGDGANANLAGIYYGLLP